MMCPFFKVKKCLKGRCIWLTKDKVCSLLLMGVDLKRSGADEC